MLNKFFIQGSRIFKVALLFLCFVLIRFYENALFYDPFLNYFKGDFNQMPLPEFDAFRLVLHLVFRYGLNMILSLAMLYVIFKDWMMIQFSFVLYGIAFVVLLTAFFVLISIYESHNNLALFYIRRFLIQPIFVLLFIPAFYFQKRNS